MTDAAPSQQDARTGGTSALAPIGGVLALAGFALLAVEVIRTLTGGVLGTVGSTLLWVGVGVMAAGLVLLVLSLATADAPAESAPDEPAAAWDDTAVIEPPAPVPPPPPPPPAPVEAGPPPPAAPAAAPPTAPVEATSPVPEPPAAEQTAVIPPTTESTTTEPPPSAD